MNATRSPWSLLGVALLAATTWSIARAGASDPTDDAAVDSTETHALSWSATYASHYSFQGFDYSDGKPVFQPSVTWAKAGLSVGVWTNLDQAREELNEFDTTVQAEWELGAGSGAFGYANLQYPHRDWEPTHEVFADLAVDSPWQPMLSVHWDVDEGQGRYWTFGIGHDVTWRGATVGLAAKLYVQDSYYALNGISALESTVSASSPWRGGTFQPSFSVLWARENGDLRGDEKVEPSWVLSLTCSSP